MQESRSEATLATYYLGAVTKAMTTTSITSSQNPSTFGQMVMFTATMTGQFGGAVSGTVTFKNCSAPLGTGTITSGVATFSTSTLARGSHNIKANYNGDGNNQISSAPLVQVVQ